MVGKVRGACALVSREAARAVVLDSCVQMLVQQRLLVRKVVLVRREEPAKSLFDLAALPTDAGWLRQSAE